jgi:hypothetical protein
MFETFALTTFGVASITIFHFSEWQIFRRKLQRKPKHIFVQYLFFWSLNVYEMKWKSTVDTEKPQKI